MIIMSLLTLSFSPLTLLSSLSINHRYHHYHTFIIIIIIIIIITIIIATISDHGWQPERVLSSFVCFAYPWLAAGTGIIINDDNAWGGGRAQVNKHDGGLTSEFAMSNAVRPVS